MSIVSKFTLITSLAVAGLATTSCTKQSSYELQDYKNIAAQITSFGIKAESNSGLADFFFSIQHGSESGLITNSKPLPYNTELKDITLDLSLAQEAEVLVAIGNATPEAWDSKKTYTIPANTELHLTVKNKLFSDRSYSYTVKINQYSYDPESISWQSLLNGTPAQLTGTLPGYTFTPAGSTESYYVQQGTQTFYRLSTTAVPTVVSFTGLPAGENIKRIASDASSVYALSTAGKLYQLQGTTWAALAGATGIYDLLGILPAYGQNTTPQLALMVTPSRSTNLDTSLALDKQALFAVYSAGKLEVSSNFVPSTFPGLKSGDHAVAFSQTARYTGSTLELVAATTSAELGKSYRSTWFTTNGTMWASLSSELIEAQLPRAMSTLLIDGSYYRLESNAAGLDIYYSTDKKSWTKSSAIALQGLNIEDMKQANFIAWNKDSYIYILRGANAANNASTSLLRGELLKSKTQ